VKRVSELTLVYPELPYFQIDWATVLELDTDIADSLAEELDEAYDRAKSAGRRVEAEAEHAMRKARRR